MTGVTADVLLTGAAFAAGLLNSVAGGGSFISFPALLLTGVHPVVANATSSVAVWPGSLASLYAYRKDIQLGRRTLLALSLASLVGGISGGLLLLYTPEVTFVRLIPWLLLLAATVFTFGGRFTRRTDADLPHSLLSVGLMQLVISIYGGYFGAGMGILMLAAYALYGMTNIHAMNGIKNLCATLINGMAVAAFIVAGAVAWRPALIMMVGAIAGGYVGAALARRVDPKRVRALVVVVAWGMTAYFFWRTFR